MTWGTNSMPSLAKDGINWLLRLGWGVISIMNIDLVIYPHIAMLNYFQVFY